MCHQPQPQQERIFLVAALVMERGSPARELYAAGASCLSGEGKGPGRVRLHSQLKQGFGKKPVCLGIFLGLQKRVERLQGFHVAPALVVFRCCGKRNHTVQGQPRSIFKL